MTTNRSRGFLTIVVLLGIGLCGAVYRAVSTAESSSASGGSPDHPIGGAATGDASAAKELAEMRRKLTALEHRLWLQDQKLALAEPAKSAGQGPAIDKDPRVDPEARADYERDQREHMAEVEAAFRQEAADPRWSSTASTAVQAALVASSDLRPLARGVECRSHTCRLEIIDDGSGTLGKSLPMFAQQVGSELPSVAVDRIEGANGTATMVLYLSRQSQSQSQVQRTAP